MFTFPSSHFTKLTDLETEKVFHDLRLEAILLAKGKRFFRQNFGSTFLFTSKKNKTSPSPKKCFMAKKPWKDPATWDDGMPRRPLSFEAEVWAGTRSPGHAVFSDHTWKLQNVQHFSMARKMVFHVTWRLSLFHRIPSKCDFRSPVFQQCSKDTSETYIWRLLTKQKKSGVWDPLPRSCVFAWNSDEILHDQDVKVSVEGSKMAQLARPTLADRHETSAWLARNFSRIWAQVAPSLDSLQCSVRALQSVFGSRQSGHYSHESFTKQFCTQSQISAKIEMNPIAKSLPFHPRRCSASFASFSRKIQIQLLSGKIDQPESLECRGSAELHGTVCFHTGSPDSKWCHLRFTWRDIELLCYYFGWNCWPFSKKGLENEVTRWIWR